MSLPTEQAQAARAAGWRVASDVTCNVCSVHSSFGWIKRNIHTGRWMRRCDTHMAAQLKLDADEQVVDAAGNSVDASDEDMAAVMEQHVPEAVVDAVAERLDDEQLERLAKQVAKDAADWYVRLVPQLVKDHVATATRHVTIQIMDRPKVEIEVAHKALPTILTAVTAGASPFLVGPAGSGKTTLAEQIAQALGLPFHAASRVTSEYKLTGFIDANGKCNRTQFRNAYENGGVFLLDEVDACDPDVLTAFNAPLAGQWGDFPDGMVKRHPDFIAIAAGNTFGRGADRQYVGRNQLDAATLDRFDVFEVDYDEDLERQIAGDEEWVRYVQRVRDAINREKVRHIVSPRASIRGARMLKAGMARSVVEEACVWKGLPTMERQRVLSAMFGA